MIQSRSCVLLATRRIYSCKSHCRFVLSGTIQLCQKAEGHTCRRHYSAACIIMLPPFRIILTLGSAPLDITRYLAHAFGTNDDSFVLYQSTLCSLYLCLAGTLCSPAPSRYYPSSLICPLCCCCHQHPLLSAALLPCGSILHADRKTIVLQWVRLHTMQKQR